MKYIKKYEKNTSLIPKEYEDFFKWLSLLSITSVVSGNIRFAYDSKKDKWLNLFN